LDPLVANAKAIIEKGSKSFAAASKLFDPQTRAKAFMLYAWCRHCDDCIDGQELGFGQQSPAPAEQRAILEALTRETRAAMDGEPVADPVFGAFQRVFVESQMPSRYPLDLLHGFAMDVDDHPYQTFDDTLLYCYHVAGVVGAMMALIMGVKEKDAEILNRAVDLGIAFQLTNISRDVMEDAADGRVYLPADWLREAGVPTDPALFPGHEARLFTVVRRMLDEADRYYDSAVYGIAHLPFRSAWAIAAARSVYGSIGRVVVSRGASAWQQRAGLSSAQKLSKLFSSLFTAVNAKWFGRYRSAPSRAGLWTLSGAAAGKR
jgi:15-cis-phytoene synthase